MTTSSDDYCTAEHENALYGCYGLPHHTGQHWSYASKVKDDAGAVVKGYDRYWYWDEVSPTFTQAEATILVTALAPMAHFFPELVEKLEGMR